MNIHGMQCTHSHEWITELLPMYSCDDAYFLWHDDINDVVSIIRKKLKVDRRFGYDFMHTRYLIM